LRLMTISYLVWRLHRQIGRLLTFEDTVDIIRRAVGTDRL
jgi:hypothetical protein